MSRQSYESLREFGRMLACVTIAELLAIGIPVALGAALYGWPR